MKHLYFWIALIDLIYGVSCFPLIILCSSAKTELIISAEYGILLLPLLLLLMFQFIIFYNKITEDKEEE